MKRGIMVDMSAAAAGFTHRLFHEFFPPPKFLEMPAVGLDLSDSAVTALELIRRKDSYVVGRFGRRALPSGAISGGYVNDKEGVIAELTKLKDELHLDFVHASVSEEKAYLFKTSIPRVPSKEMRSVLEFKLEEHVPVPAAETVFDYTVIAPNGHAPPDHIDVGVTVLPRKVVDTYTELLSVAELVPLSFEIEAQAIARAVVKGGDRGAHLIVNFGEEKTGLFIVSDAVVYFTSTVTIGGRNITEAFAKHLSVSREEAEKIKRERTALFARADGELFFSLMNAVSALKDEVNKLSVYWRTHQDAGGDARKKIEKVVLTGRDAALPGFDEYLALSLSVPVEVGNVWRNICSFDDYIPPIPFDESLDYAAAVGLALPKSQ